MLRWLETRRLPAVRAQSLASDHGIEQQQVQAGKAAGVAGEDDRAHVAYKLVRREVGVGQQACRQLTRQQTLGGGMASSVACFDR